MDVQLYMVRVQRVDVLTRARSGSRAWPPDSPVDGDSVSGRNGGATSALIGAAVTAPTTAHTEAPASVTIKVRLRGHDVMLTLRGSSGADVLPKTLAAIDWLEAHGAEPAARRQGPPAPVDPNAPLCPTHGAPMRQGRAGWYCPRKDDAGVYCRQKA